EPAAKPPEPVAKTEVAQDTPARPSPWEAPKPGRAPARTNAGSGTRQTASVRETPPPPVSAAPPTATQPPPESGPPATPPAPQDPPARVETSRPIVAPPQPPPPPEPAKVTLNAGTLLSVRLVDGLNAERNAPGDVFAGTLDKELTADGFV